MKNDPRSYDRNFYNCVKKPEKIQDFNGALTRDYYVENALLSVMPNCMLPCQNSHLQNSITKSVTKLQVLLLELQNTRTP